MHRIGNPVDGAATPSLRGFESHSCLHLQSLFTVKAMHTLLDLLPFVKGQAAFHEKMAAKKGLDSKSKAMRLELATKFRALQAAIDEANKALAAIPPSMPAIDNPLELNLEDLVGLPPELVSQLNITESDKYDGMIVEIINAAGKTMLLDKLMIALYKRTSESPQRNQLISRLYRLSKKGKVFSLPRRKGFYTTIRSLEPEDAEEAPPGETPA